MFSKYPNEYFPLGSGTAFLESYDATTDKLHWKFAFLIVDSSKSDERKYLVEDNDSTLRKYFGATHLYYGRHSHHYELGLYVDFIGYLTNNSANFIYDTTADGLKKEFIQLVKGISISGSTEKEKFAQSLLNFLAQGYFLHIEEHKKIDSVMKWLENELVITDIYDFDYSVGRRQSSPTLRICFDGDTISSISLK